METSSTAFAGDFGIWGILRCNRFRLEFGWSPHRRLRLRVLLDIWQDTALEWSIRHVYVLGNFLLI